MTPFQERACHGIGVLIAIAMIVLIHQGYERAVMVSALLLIAVVLLPFVIPVPRPGSVEDVFTRLRRWKPESGKPRPKLPYERD